MARRLPERTPVADITVGNVITVEADDITGVPAPRLPDYFVFIARRLECDEGKDGLRRSSANRPGLDRDCAFNIDPPASSYA
jgi:hypothetical protein